MWSALWRVRGEAEQLGNWEVLLAQVRAHYHSGLICLSCGPPNFKTLVLSLCQIFQPTVAPPVKEFAHLCTSLSNHFSGRCHPHFTFFRTAMLVRNLPLQRRHHIRLPHQCKADSENTRWPLAYVSGAPPLLTAHCSKEEYLPADLLPAETPWLRCCLSHIEQQVLVCLLPLMLL